MDERQRTKHWWCLHLSPSVRNQNQRRCRGTKQLKLLHFHKMNIDVLFSNILFLMAHFKCCYWIQRSRYSYRGCFLFIYILVGPINLNYQHNIPTHALFPEILLLWFHGLIRWLLLGFYSSRATFMFSFRALESDIIWMGPTIQLNLKFQLSSCKYIEVRVINLFVVQQT